jgi:hypothetical protein
MRIVRFFWTIGLKMIGNERRLGETAQAKKVKNELQMQNESKSCRSVGRLADAQQSRREIRQRILTVTHGVSPRKCFNTALPTVLQQKKKQVRPVRTRHKMEDVIRSIKNERFNLSL